MFSEGEEKMNWNLLVPEYRYWGLRVEPDPIGTKMLCFGFWWFHIYYNTCEKYR